MNIVYIGNDNYIEVDGLKDKATDAYINDATVACTLKDSGGNNVTGQSWPLTLSYVASSNGKYRGLLDNALVLTARKMYTAHITVVGGGLDAAWELPVFAMTRTG